MKVSVTTRKVYQRQYVMKLEEVTTFSKKPFQKFTKFRLTNSLPSKTIIIPFTSVETNLSLRIFIDTEVGKAVNF